MLAVDECPKTDPVTKCCLVHLATVDRSRYRS